MQKVTGEHGHSSSELFLKKDCCSYEVRHKELKVKHLRSQENFRNYEEKSELRQMTAIEHDYGSPGLSSGSAKRKAT